MAIQYSYSDNGCTFSLENLSRPVACGCNGAGVKKIWMIPYSVITSFNVKNAVFSKFTEYVELEFESATSNYVFDTSNGVDIYPFINVYSAKDLGELKYTVQGNVGGRSLKASLEFTHPSFKKEALGWFNQYMNTELLVVVLLNNGEYHVLGNKDSGATFADGAEGTSGKAFSDQVGFTPTIEWDTCIAQVMPSNWTPEDGITAQQNNGNCKLPLTSNLTTTV